MLQQQEQLLQERIDKNNEYNESLLDRLLLLSSFIGSLEKDIIEQGKIMEVFYKKEKENPSDMNTMYFNVNKNYTRVIEMDSLTLFKAFRYFIKGTVGWEKSFLNTLKLIDFYSEALIDLRVKYKLHINDKVKEHKQIGYDIQNFLNLASILVDEYLKNYGFPSNLNQPWPKLMNEFIGDYYKYLKENSTHSYRYISDVFLDPFIKKAMQLRKEFGYDSFGSREIIMKVSYIRKKINEIEAYSRQYAFDIERQYNDYYSQNNEHINELNGIKVLIDSMIKKKA